MTSRNSNLEALVARLMSDHYTDLVRWAAWKVNEFVAEDAVSFAFGQLALGLMQDGHPEPVAWLRVVAHNEALRMIRKPQGDVSLDAMSDAYGYEAAAMMGDPELAIELTAKRQMLDQLKPDQRAALEDKAEGYSYKEIVERRGWTYTKVNRCIAEGKAALRRLQAEGGES